jgi:NNP family nitrate/nitrite transporter-like MFS transporter
VTPAAGNPLVAFAKITYLYSLAFIPSIAILYIYLPAPTGLGPDQHVGGECRWTSAARS